MMNRQYLDLARKIVRVADQKLGIDIMAMDVRGRSSITDCFVFIGATSHLHVQALEDAIREELHRAGVSPLRTDGQRGHVWRALDYGSVMIHIMEKKIREFYSIERLWVHCKNITPALMEKPKARRAAPKKPIRRKVKTKRTVRSGRAKRRVG